MIGVQKLGIVLTNLMTTIPRKEWKYYHLQSIENFIYHLESIKNERTRILVMGEIEKYLDSVNNILDDEMDLHNKSKHLFPSIWKLSDTYKYEVGFIQKPSYLVSLILITTSFFLLSILFTKVVSAAICIVVSSLYFLYAYRKAKAKKTF